MERDVEQDAVFEGIWCAAFWPACVTKAAEAKAARFVARALRNLWTAAAGTVVCGDGEGRQQPRAAFQYAGYLLGVSRSDSQPRRFLPGHCAPGGGLVAGDLGGR